MHSWCYDALRPDVGVADDDVVDMHRQTCRTVGAIAAHYHLGDGLVARPYSGDPGGSAGLDSVQPDGERAVGGREYVLQFQAVPGIEAGHATGVEGVGVPVVEGER